MKIKENFSLRKLNTFGINVRAKYFAEVSDDEELKKLLLNPKFKNIDKLMLGGGSNILFTKDFNDIVINICSNKINVVEETNEYVFVKASAGVIWHELVLFCVEKNYGGIENLSLIPGKVGAAPIQNIGAYGQELKDVFHSLKGFFIKDAKEKTFYNNDCDFAYRSSIFKKELKNKFVITEVILKLSKHPVLNTSYGAVEDELKKQNLKEVTIKNVSDAVCKIRRSKLPDPNKIGNAGSFFKNPEISKEKFEKLKQRFEDIIGYKISDSLIKVPAGWLIEKAGLKGKRIGNTGTHAKQALVIVNYGNALGKEILDFKNFIKDKVEKKFGIKLEEEVNIV